MNVTDPEVDDAILDASPMHPPPSMSRGLSLADDLDLGPITKRVLANDYNRILRRHGSNKTVSPGEAAACNTVGDAEDLVAGKLR